MIGASKEHIDLANQYYQIFFYNNHCIEEIEREKQEESQYETVHIEPEEAPKLHKIKQYKILYISMTTLVLCENMAAVFFIYLRLTPISCQSQERSSIFCMVLDI